VKDNPLAVKDPEFKCENTGVLSNIAVGVEISKPESGYKSSRLNNVFFDTSNGGYPMRVAVRLNSYDAKWHTIDAEVSSISIQIPGDYEASELIESLQHIGLMTLPVYGRMNNLNNSEEE